MLYQDDEPDYLQLHQSYMIEAFGDIQIIADDMARSGLYSDTYDTLIGIGLSGALVVPRLAGLLGKRWAIVRKQDGSHSSNPIEGQIGRKWLFVDDMVSSGKTLRMVLRTIKDISNEFHFDTKYVGTYQYHFKSFIEQEDSRWL